MNRYTISGSCVIGKGKVYKDEKTVFTGQVSAPADFLAAVYQDRGLTYPKFFKMDLLSKLGFLAAEILLKGTFSKEGQRPEDTGLVLCNAHSSLDTDLTYYKTVADIASPALFVYTLPNIVIGEICIRHQFKGENTFFVFKAFDGTFITDYVGNLLDNDLLRNCICGWVDLLDETYEAALFLVEKENKGHATPFTEENLTKIYHLAHG